MSMIDEVPEEIVSETRNRASIAYGMLTRSFEGNLTLIACINWLEETQNKNHAAAMN